MRYVIQEADKEKGTDTRWLALPISKLHRSLNSAYQTQLHTINN